MVKKVLFVVLLIGFIGCASTHSNHKADTSSSTQTSDADMQNIPSSSKFSKLSLGMGDTQVRDLIGQPNDIGWRRTGKQWIPFYHGSDTNRRIYYYKGEGRLEFNNLGKLVNIDYDPSEDGYK